LNVVLVQVKPSYFKKQHFTAFIVTFKPSKAVLVVEYLASLSHFISFFYLTNMPLAEKKETGTDVIIDDP
jgi:hypothetical protein